MTKKDYIVLAGALAASRPLRGAYAPPDWDQRFRQWRADVAVLIDVLRADNPRFDADRFIMATNAPISEREPIGGWCAQCGVAGHTDESSHSGKGR